MNIYSDPAFYATTGDSAFFLTAESPCIDAGDPESPLDPDGTITDMGAYYYHQSFGIDETKEYRLPTEFRLHPVYPNPFNSSAVVSYDLLHACQARVTVYNVSGRMIASLSSGWHPAGRYRRIFDGTGYPSGIYFVRLQAGNRQWTGKLDLVK